MHGRDARSIKIVGGRKRKTNAEGRDLRYSSRRNGTIRNYTRKIRMEGRDPSYSSWRRSAVLISTEDDRKDGITSSRLRRERGGERRRQLGRRNRRINEVTESDMKDWWMRRHTKGRRVTRLTVMWDPCNDFSDRHCLKLISAVRQCLANENKLDCHHCIKTSP